MANKHICFDLRPLQIGHQNRGIGMHIISLLENLPKDSDELTFSYYYFNDSNPIEQLKIEAPKGQLIATPSRRHAVKKPSDIKDIYKLTTHDFAELSNQAIDVFVQFDATLGLTKIRGTKTVVIGYDLIPLIFRNQYLPGLGHSLSHTIGKRAKSRAAVRSLYYNWKYNKSCNTLKQAHLILSISDSTRRSFIETLGIKPDNIKTIHLAPVDLSNKGDDTILSGIAKPYIFYIGGVDYRKRVSDTVKIFNLLKSRGHDIQLVLAGLSFRDMQTLPDDKTRSLIQRSPYRRDIILKGFITDSQKRSLYTHAQAFVFTTAYEGFGLPAIEAMALGCPVVCYDNSSLPEVVGKAAILVEDGHYVSAANETEHLIESPDLRNQLIQAGYKQAKTFSWEKYVRAFLDAIDHL